MKTSQLAGVELDYWVARAEGYVWAPEIQPLSARGVPAYSTDWAQGGPIIDAKAIYFEPSNYQTDGPIFAYVLRDGAPLHGEYGDTRLQAAMRAYVASEFGEDVGDLTSADGHDVGHEESDPAVVLPHGAVPVPYTVDMARMMLALGYRYLQEKAPEHLPVVLPATAAAHDVVAERRRQVEQEGWTQAHDDEHPNEEIAACAAFYALPDAAREWPAEETGYGNTFGEAIWPEDWTRPKTGDRRRELVKAGALILAEIERRDRADRQAGSKHSPQ